MPVCVVKIFQLCIIFLRHVCERGGIRYSLELCLLTLSLTTRFFGVANLFVSEIIGSLVPDIYLGI